MHDQTIIEESQTRNCEASKEGVQRPVLVVLEGGDLKTRYKINEREMVLGRDLSCNIILTDVKSSRRHVKLTYHNFETIGAQPKVELTDLGSTNGCFVNGKRVTEVELQDRDKIMIGSTLFGYFLRDEKMIKADDSLIRLASTDALTGLKNRGVFNLEINREFDRARRYGRNISLCLFDIDHFKRFNDAYGHQTGDLILRELGTIILQNCRVNDVSARYGGEEFAIILPETALERSVIYAERLRKTVMDHPFKDKNEDLHVTISVGVSSPDEWMEHSTELIEAADRALYQAKEAGRNQVCWHRSDPGATIRQIV